MGGRWVERVYGLISEGGDWAPLALSLLDLYNKSDPTQSRPLFYLLENIDISARIYPSHYPLSTLDDQYLIARVPGVGPSNVALLKKTIKETSQKSSDES